ncbi:AAA family ATPase [Microbacterium sp. XT11]|uniref:AAA family ATPase n=1 Tax=Microbacterium sp. XT11 TaxID=367477 RepID=UPI0009FA0030|nr:AAA family ATPase [Microbacterium sp. XT11]
MAESKASARQRPRLVGKDDELSLSVSGYKAIRDEMTLRIAPLTIIAGANSAGKSSFMQPFLLMKQTLDSAFDPGPLLLHGPNVRATDRSQILSRGKSRSDVVQRFSAGMKTPRDSRKVTFGIDGLDLVIETDEIGEDGQIIRLAEPLRKSDEKVLKQRFADLAQRYLRVLRDTEAHGADSWGFDVVRNRCFLDLTLDLGVGDRRFGISVSDELTDDRRWVDLLRGIIHVPGLRGNPERSYSRSAVGSTFPGTFDTYVASIVYQWTEKDRTRLDRLSRQLEELGLTWKLTARRLNDASIELLVGRTQHAQQGGANDVVSVADVGFGVSQTLPVLVALLTAKPGQIVYLEQPEIHLHPKAQLVLAAILVEAAGRGVRVVAETHSSLVIRGIQTAVAERQLQPNDLSFNWFGRDALTGFQTITTANVDEAGRFGDWPLDFDDVSREADWAYLDAVEERETGGR